MPSPKQQDSGSSGGHRISAPTGGGVMTKAKLLKELSVTEAALAEAKVVAKRVAEPGTINAVKSSQAVALASKLQKRLCPTLMEQFSEGTIMETEVRDHSALFELLGPVLLSFNAKATDPSYAVDRYAQALAGYIHGKKTDQPLAVRTPGGGPHLSGEARVLWARAVYDRIDLNGEP